VEEKNNKLCNSKEGKRKQYVKIVEKWEIVRNGLVNIFVMLVIMIDNEEMECG